MSITFEQAAEARAAGMPAAASRPSSRRENESPTAKPLVRAASHIELRAKKTESGSGLEFVGYASVVDRGYEMWDAFGPYTEKVAGTAFDKTLAAPSLEVPLVLAHDPMRRLARTKNGTLRLSVDDTGLRVEADLDPSDPDVAYIAPKLRSGLIDEMSFRFAITAGEWSSDWTEFHINEVDLNRGDVAIVGYGANPYTSGELRAADLLPHITETEARAAYEALRERFAPRLPAVRISDDEIRHRVIPGLG